MPMLLEDLLSVLGVLSTGQTRYVSATGEDSATGEAPHLPYRTIARALQDASAMLPGERLTIQLQGDEPFTESLELPSHVTIRGPGVIVAASTGPALTIDGTEQAPIEDVALLDLTVRGTGAYQGSGGAIAVDRASALRIERCTLEQSKAGRGGGLAVTSSRAVKVTDCTVRGNVAAGTIDQGAPTDVLPMPTGEGRGGGIFVRDSDIEITGCVVTGNAAIFAGGGIAVSNVDRRAAPVVISGCEITSNQVAHAALTRLGAPWQAIAPAPRDDLGDPLADAMPDVNLRDYVLGAAHGLKRRTGFGGGVSLEHTRQGTTIRGCHIGVSKAGAPGPNIARRGGGIHLYIGAFPAITDCVIANNAASGDGGGLGADFFDPFAPGPGPSFGVFFPEPMVERAPILISGTRFVGNHAIEDGGAIYMTGNAQPRISGGLFKSNRAGEHGGAIRVTYASQLEATGVEFTANEANVFNKNAGDDEGGGALSARNSDVLLQRCAFTANIAHRFAGGAIYFRDGIEGTVNLDPTNGSSLGIVGDIIGIFDEIQERHFHYGRRVLRIVDCTASGNHADGASGAGGFLYALRNAGNANNGNFLGGTEPMWVSIEGARTAIRGSISDYDRPDGAGRRKRGTVSIELSGKTTAAGVSEDRFSLGRDVPAGAIATSTPAPDGRAIVLMPAAATATDQPFPLQPAGPIVLGPSPTITGVAPSTVGTTSGTRRIRISGTGFEEGMRVRIGAKEYPVAAESGIDVDVDLPEMPAGVHPVTVLLASGASAVLAGGLTVPPAPKVTAITPRKGRPGDTVQLRGVGLPLGTEVFFVFGATAEEVTPTQNAADRLSVVVPEPPQGFDAAVLRVRTPLGQTWSTPPLQPFRFLEDD